MVAGCHDGYGEVRAARFVVGGGGRENYTAVAGADVVIINPVAALVIVAFAGIRWASSANSARLSQQLLLSEIAREGGGKHGGASGVRVEVRGHARHGTGLGDPIETGAL